MTLKSALATTHLLLLSFASATPISQPSDSPALSTEAHVIRSPNARSDPPVSTEKYLFSFGSSYTQTGFNITRTKPSTQNPIGNPTYPGYTTTGGENWVDFLLTKYNTSLTLGYNFGFGGATTNRSIVPPSSASILTLVDEVAIWKQNLANHPSWAPWTSRNSLVAIWMSGNDVANSWQTGIDIEVVFPQVAESIFGQAKVLLEAGARNFVFANVPPIQRTPLNLSNGVNTTKLEIVVARFNAILADHFTTFKNGYGSESKAVLVDVQPLFNKVLDNPTAYGAPDATCFNSDGMSCLWWNNYHPGIKIHSLIAELFSEEFRGISF